jgi:hypothetical protein
MRVRIMKRLFLPRVVGRLRRLKVMFGISLENVVLLFDRGPARRPTAGSMMRVICPGVTATMAHLERACLTRSIPLSSAKRRLGW